MKMRVTLGEKKDISKNVKSQSSNTRTLGYVPYRQCQYIISLKDKDSTEQTKSDDLRYTGPHLMKAPKSYL